MRKSAGEKTFTVFNYLLLTVLILVFALPYLLIVATSLTKAESIFEHGPSLIIRGLSFESYIYLFTAQDLFLNSVGVSLFVTCITVVLSVFVNAAYAYVVSRKGFVGQKFFSILILITMLFSGGTIPGYIVTTGLGLKNSVWALILPGIISAWYVFLIRSFFSTIPDSLDEAARLDGATNIRILIKIYMPLSKPIIATIALYTAVASWNAWTGAMLYLDSQHKNLYPLSYLVREIINDSNLTGGTADIAADGVKNAAVVVSTLPIILVYPFLQKYFISGVLVGSIKE